MGDFCPKIQVGEKKYPTVVGVWTLLLALNLEMVEQHSSCNTARETLSVLGFYSD